VRCSDDRLDRQVGQDLLAEKPGPGSVEELPPLGSQVRPRVKKRACASVPDVKHEFSRNGLIFKENCTKTRPGSQGESDRKAKKISRLSKNDFLRGHQGYQTRGKFDDSEQEKKHIKTKSIHS